MAKARSPAAQHASHGRWLAGVAVTCAVLVIGYAAMVVTSRPPSPQVIRLGALVDQHGARFASQPGSHGYKLVVFGYTSCADVCPASLFKVREVLNALGRRSTSLAPLFVTLDPIRDTLPVLAEYVTAFDPRIVGLSGSVDEVQSLARAYGVSAPTQGGKPDSTIDHSAMIYLLGPDNAVLAVYGSTGTAPAIADDLLRQITLSEHLRDAGATA